MSTLKQSPALVTALKRKYKSIFFYSTSFKIFNYLFTYTIFVGLLLYSFVTYFFNYLVKKFNITITETPFQILVQDLLWQLLFVILIFGILSILCAYLTTKVASFPITQAHTLQKHFISGIAHELRTPLSILRINNELARLDTSKNINFEELLNENISDIDRINDILNTILHYDRLANTKTIQFGNIKLQKILITVTSRLSAVAKQKNIDLLITTASTKETLGNQVALEQAFFNIVENAIMYSPPNTDVLISCSETANSVMIKIKDAGIGIPEKDIPHIFEPFYRSEKTGKLSGVGIGLAIVEQIIRLHKGSISVTSSQKRGTEFTITLPTLTTVS